MKGKKCVSLVLVLLMVLTMVFTNVVYAEGNEDKPLSQNEVVTVIEAPAADVQPVTKDAGPQLDAPLLAPVAEATVRVNASYSNADPDKASTIQEAVNKVAAGGTVIVEAGTYNETVNIDNSMTIQSDVDLGAVVNGGFIIYPNKSDITIGTSGHGFKISSTQKAAISINSSTLNCKVIGNQITANGGYGIITAGSQKNLEVSSNTITGVNAVALFFASRQITLDYPDDPITNTGSMDYSSNITLNGNTFSGFSAFGVIMNALNSPISNNVFNLNAAIARLLVMVNSGLNTANTVFGNSFVVLPGFTHKSAQFMDTSKTWDLEAVRKANSFDQAAYISGTYDKIYYYIQDAIDNTKPGDTVYVGTGVYTEKVVINPDDSFITLINRDSAATPYSAIINNPNSQMDAMSLEINGAQVNLEGFEIHGMSATNSDGSFFNKNKFTGKNYGAVILGSDNDTVKVATVSQNLFTGNKLGGLVVDKFNYHRNQSDVTSNMTIVGNTFTANGIKCAPCGTPKAVVAFGAHISNSLNVSIYDNYFTNNTGNGLELENINSAGNNLLIEDFNIDRFNTINCLIKHNWINNNGDGLYADQVADDVGAGIVAEDCNDLEIIDNYSIAGNKGDGIALYDCHDITVKGNNDSRTGYSGIINNGMTGINFGASMKGVAASIEGSYFHTMGDVVVSDNLIKNNGDFGVYGIIATKATITGNTVNNNGTGGLVYIYAVNATVSGNIIDNNGVLPVAARGLDLNVSHFATISENEIVGNTGIGLYLYKGDADILNNLIQSNVGGGIYLADRKTDANIQKNNILQNGSANGMGGIFINGTATVHYNNIVGNLPFGVELVNPEIRAEEGKVFTFNFWGDSSGPIDTFQRSFADAKADVYPVGSGNLLGECNAIILSNAYKTRSVNMYAPWLSNKFELLGKYDNSGKTAEPVIPYAVKAGWNFLSTPKMLAVDSWSDIANIGVNLDASLILGYNATTKKWMQASEMKFTPQDAYFVRMNSVDLIPMVIKMHTLDDMNWTVPVVKELKAGWNLVSKSDDNTDPMTVREVLVSTQGAELGWQYVIHPDIDYGYGRSQDAYTYTNASSGREYMFNFAGYWVYMNSDKLLAGGTTSYVWDYDINKINKLMSLTDKILNPREITTP